MSLTETTLERRLSGKVPHPSREQLVDSFYVLEGTLGVRLGDGVVEAGPGSYVFVPPGNVHTFSNPGDEPVRMLNLIVPGGFEQYLREVARVAGEAPPAARGHGEDRLPLRFVPAG